MKIHFIGIGGIGVSSLAQYYLETGNKVSGSDLVSSEVTDTFKKKGVKIFIGQHKAKNVPKDVDLIIYSPAVKPNNPELRKNKSLSYPQALGKLTKKYYTIAVCGTHGKSTTSAMIALTLIKAGLDPIVILGTKLKEFKNTNCRVGKSKFLVIEADEWKAALLNYWPKIIVLTNIEKEHLDFYKDLNHILKTYKEFINHLPKDGILVANGDDPNIKRIFRTLTSKDWRKYSLKQKEAKKLKGILRVPGQHNVYNAQAALEVARTLKIPDKTTFKALSEYQGAWRRFEIIKNKITIISDYAHHPTEIQATLQAAREKFPKSKIWVVFQPHQYQRTFYLFKNFVKVFQKAATIIDKLIITDIYDVAGRETGKIKNKISSERLVKTVNKSKVIYLQNSKIVSYLKKNLNQGDILIIMGAGSIYKVIHSFT